MAGGWKFGKSIVSAGGRRWLIGGAVLLAVAGAVVLGQRAGVFARFWHGPDAQATQAAESEHDDSWTFLASFLAIMFLLAACGMIWSVFQKEKQEEASDRPPSSGEPRPIRWGRIWVELVREFCVGLFVAVFVAGLFESVMHAQATRAHNQQMAEIHKKHEQQMDAIAQNVFPNIFGYEIDKGVIDEVYKSVFRAGLLRKDMCVTYEFRSRAPNEKPTDSGERRLQIRITVSYHIQNRGSDPIDHRIEPYFQELLPLGDTEAKFTAFEVDDEEGKPVASAAELPLTVRRARYANLEERARTLDKPRLVRILPARTVTVRYAYETLRRFTDMAILVTHLPADSLTMKAVLCGDGVSDLEFAPDASHRQKPVLVSVRNKDDQCGYYEWKIEKPILPYQGIILHWYQKSAGAKSEP